MAKHKDKSLQVYGPRMTPSIFATKWCTKLSAFMYTHFLASPQQDISWICNMCSKGIDLLSHFHAQAAELSLTIRDFPDERMQGRAIDWETKRIGAEENPFKSAGGLIAAIGSYMERFKAWKHGEWVMGMAWQKLPLKDRQQINELLVCAAEVEGEDWWLFYRELVEQAADKLRVDEAVGTKWLQGM